MDTLWNIIRDFFVKYVFGGTDSIGNIFYEGFQIGTVVDAEMSEFYLANSYTLYLPFNGFIDTSGAPIQYIGLGDWLSTTATIITLIALFIGITMLTIKLFKFVSNAISMR